jgi:ABC-type protease/lipase transport system fused ATPase/permease subunit
MMSFPRPEGQVVASRVVLTPENSDKIVLSDVSFKLGCGRVLGVVGPSGAGKSSLAKLLTGAWRPRRGSISIDGNDLAHWHQDELGKFIGYVPQDVEFLPGSVAQNIARFDADMAACHGAVLEAAQLAGVQDVIQALPEGYDTLIGPDGYAFSGGQRQLLALARALYGMPSLVVLDEPNSNLDAVGEKSLGNTLSMLRSRSCTVIIITHRVNMLAFCDDVLVMSSGTVHTFGPRELIMKKLSTINGPRAETQLLGQAG